MRGAGGIPRASAARASRQRGRANSTRAMSDRAMPNNTEQLLLLISERRIRARIAALARRIDADYRGRTLCLVVVLKGASVFAADLARQLATPSTTDFVSASSYGTGTRSCGKVALGGTAGRDFRGLQLDGR